MRPIVRECRVPAKTFLFGEYLALVGGPSALLTFEPSFILRSTPGKPLQGIHPKSPAGLLLAEGAEAGDVEAEFLDPFSGAGGFGASSAQFLAVLAMMQGHFPSLASVLDLYRSLHRESPLPPSGADVGAQLSGGIASAIPSLLVFSATGLPARKTATHDHLASLARRGYPEKFSPLLSALREITQRGLDAIRAGDVPAVGKAMNDYAEALLQAELEAPATTDLRRKLEKNPSVYGVKGSGALQSDALILVAKESEHAALVKDLESQGLRCVVRGYVPSPGASLSQTGE